MHRMSCLLCSVGPTEVRPKYVEPSAKLAAATLILNIVRTSAVDLFVTAAMTPKLVLSSILELARVDKHKQ